MNWSLRQMRRLAEEKAVLRTELPHFTFRGCDNGSESHVSGWERSPDYRHDYSLRLDIPKGYPEEMPQLWVAKPSPLLRYDGTPIPKYSHGFHTRSHDSVSGMVEICHCSPSSWTPSMTVTGTLFRGILWIWCFEKHLRTGRTIEDIYGEIRRRLDKPSCYAYSALQTLTPFTFQHSAFPAEESLHIPMKYQVIKHSELPFAKYIELR